MSHEQTTPNELMHTIASHIILHIKHQTCVERGAQRGHAAHWQMVAPQACPCATTDSADGSRPGHIV